MKGTPRRIQPDLVRGASPTVQLHLDLENHDFPESLDMLYFREFVSLVQGPCMTGQSIRGGLWKVTMPQMARMNPALRHAAMAVGIMSMWYSRSGCRSARSSCHPSPILAATRQASYTPCPTTSSP